MSGPAVHGEAASWVPGRVGPVRALLRLAGALAVMAGVAALASAGGDPALYWPGLAWALGLAVVTVLALIRPARRDRRGWQATVLAVMTAVLVKFAVTGAPVAWAPAAAAAWTAVTLAPRAVRTWRRPPDWGRSQRAEPST